MFAQISSLPTGRHYLSRIVRQAERNLRTNLTPIEDISIIHNIGVAINKKTCKFFTGKLSISDGNFEEILKYKNGREIFSLLRRKTGEKLWAIGEKIKMFTKISPEETDAYSRFCATKSSIYSRL